MLTILELCYHPTWATSMEIIKLHTKPTFENSIRIKKLYPYLKKINFSSSLRIFSKGMTFIFDYHIQNPAQITGCFYLEVALWEKLGWSQASPQC